MHHVIYCLFAHGRERAIASLNLGKEQKMPIATATEVAIPQEAKMPNVWKSVARATRGINLKSPKIKLCAKAKPALRLAMKVW